MLLLTLSWVYLTLGNIVNNYALDSECYEVLKMIDRKLDRIQGLIGQNIPMEPEFLPPIFDELPRRRKRVAELS